MSAQQVSKSWWKWKCASYHKDFFDSTKFVVLIEGRMIGNQCSGKTCRKKNPMLQVIFSIMALWVSVNKVKLIVCCHHPSLSCLILMAWGSTCILSLKLMWPFVFWPCLFQQSAWRQCVTNQSIILCHLGTTWPTDCTSKIWEEAAQAHHQIRI